MIMRRIRIRTQTRKNKQTNKTYNVYFVFWGGLVAKIGWFMVLTLMKKLVLIFCNSRNIKMFGFQ